MKRTLLYLAIAALLAVLVYFAVVQRHQGSYSKKETAFAVQDTTEIAQVVLSDLNGDTAILEHRNGIWLINGKYRARADAVSNLLQTLHDMQVKTPVSKAMHDIAVKQIATDRVKVDIFNAHNEKIKGYFVGPPSTTYNGNFMLMEDAHTPFIVSIPGFEGFLSTRFFTDETEWRDRAVFRYDPATIKEVDVTYSIEKDSSFSIVRQGDGNYALLHDQKVVSGSNPEILKAFIRQFSLLNCESYIPDAYKKDSLLQNDPVCTIHVEDLNGNGSTLKIYYRPVTYRTKLQFNYQSQALKYDVDKFYGIFNDDRDLAIVQNFVFGKLFVGPRFFFRHRPQVQSN